MERASRRPTITGNQGKATASRLLGALGLALALCACAGEEAKPGIQHVLLISLDTTRADQIGCYGDPNAKTPRIDELAKGGVVFEQMTSAAPSTLSSHTSMMTGLYPRRHGVARNGFMVNQDNLMLAEVLGENGFHTAGIIASYALDQEFDFDQGFDWWDQELGNAVNDRERQLNERPAGAVTDAVLAHLDRLDGEERLFVFAHYFDPHAPYAPPEPFASEFAKPGGPTTSNFKDLARQVDMHQELVSGKQHRVYDLGLSLELAQWSEGTVLPGDEDLHALYSGEMAYLDEQVGRLLDGFEERGLLDSTLVILTADHGETFWEHGDFWHHGAWVYETNVHVPCLVRLPEGQAAGTRVSEPISGVDLFPTVLDLLEIPVPKAVAGLSLVPAFEGRKLPDERPIFSEATQPGSLLDGRTKWANQQKAKSLRVGRWKLIDAPYLRYQALYNLKKDPGETQNLLLDLNPKRKAIAEQMTATLAKWTKVQNPRPSAFNSTQKENVMKRLKDLGYTGDVKEIDED